VETPAGQQDVNSKFVRLMVEIEAPGSFSSDQLLQALHQRGLTAKLRFVEGQPSDSPRKPPPPPPSKPDPYSIWPRPSGYGGAAIAMLTFFLMWAALILVWVTL
jgi:hypothetical protein